MFWLCSVVQHLQNSINDLPGCTNFGMSISGSKIQVMHFSVSRKTANWTLKCSFLKEVPGIKYLGCVFFHECKFREIEHRRMNGNKVMEQLRSHLFNKTKLSKQTKWIIESSDRLCCMGAKVWLIHFINAWSRSDWYESSEYNKDRETKDLLLYWPKKRRIVKGKWQMEVQPDAEKH